MRCSPAAAAGGIRRAAATRSTASVDVAQVSVQGIESIKYWNGSSYAALRGAALYTDPSTMPAAGGKLSRVA
jgi:hypothetical protein